MNPITVYPIGVVSDGRSQIFEDHWGTVISRLILDPAELDRDAALGLAEFSHLEVVIHHKQTRIRRDAAHQRGNPAWPRVGVLAGHSPVRPNLLGMSRCALLEVAGLELTVQGLDAIDGTPILDIKPNTTGFQPRDPIREPAWTRQLMAIAAVRPTTRPWSWRAAAASMQASRLARSAVIQTRPWSLPCSAGAAGGTGADLAAVART